MIAFPALVEMFLDQYANKPCYPNYKRIVIQYFVNWPDHPTFLYLYDWHRALAGSPDHANKSLGFLKTMYFWAMQRGLHPGPNPAVGIKAHQTFSRERVMETRELLPIIQALPTLPVKPAALLSILSTVGCRPIEARSMQWNAINLSTGQWTQWKTKNGKAHTTYLSTQARAYLLRIPQTSPYVFTGAVPNTCWTESGIDKMWKELRGDLGVPDVRLHDFRRTVATHLYETTKDEYLVKRCLNHSVKKNATAVYIRVPYDTLAKALQAQADRFFTVAPSLTITLSAAPAMSQTAQPVLG